jgi:hypothetical protein
LRQADVLNLDSFNSNSPRIGALFEDFLRDLESSTNNDNRLINRQTSAMLSRSLSISLRVFVPSTFLKVVCAKSLVLNWASFTFVTEITYQGIFL